MTRKVKVSAAPAAAEAQPESPMKAVADALKRKAEAESFENWKARQEQGGALTDEEIITECIAHGMDAGVAFPADKAAICDAFRAILARAASEPRAEGLDVEAIAKAAWDEAWELAFSDGESAGHPLGRSRLNRDSEWGSSEVRAALAAAEAQPDRVKWDKFPAWLIDHHEGDTITEELLQRALADMLKAHPPVAHSRQEQSRPVPDEGRDALPPLPYPDLWRHGAGFQGYTAKPGEGPWFTAAQMRQYAQAAHSRQAQGGALSDDDALLNIGIAAWEKHSQQPWSPDGLLMACVAVRDAVLSRAASEPRAEGLTDAARDVLAERQRQIEAEGWTPEHDDQHREGEMAEAAAAYASESAAPHGGLPMCWPWAKEWWKPADPRRNLVKAGALILAEIERLDRAAHQPTGGGNAD